MLIPKADRATIDPAKLRDYFLSATHPIGRSKVRFFTAPGFAPDRWEELAEALRLQHLTKTGAKAGRGSSASTSNPTGDDAPPNNDLQPTAAGVIMSRHG